MRGAVTLANESSVRRYRNPQDGFWHIQVTQGETYVTDSDSEVLTTILGSCVAACIRDPLVRIGGMNHFLLPKGGGDGAMANRFGVNAMEMLINDILKRGGVRSRLEAKLFGGAKVIPGLSDVGSSNIAFAEKFLADENIRFIGGDVRGTAARRIQYWPASGRARQLSVANVDKADLAKAELAKAEQTISNRLEGGDDVELF